MDQQDRRTKLPTLYIPHGAGPCFFMNWTMGPADTWNKTAAWLRGLASTMARPRAIVVISGHWEAAAFTVTSQAQPPLLYDYYGFPEHTYALAYAAPGAPALALQIVQRLRHAGLPAGTDATRGFDHGVFVPFKLIYPEADIPIVQLSLRNGLDPAEHLAAGKALAGLRDDGVLIVGSGMSYHNMRGFGRKSSGPTALAFDTWLQETAAIADETARFAALSQWASSPHGRDAHPREEHLLPLFVAAGAAGGPGHREFTDEVLGVTVSALRFGGA